MNDSLENLQDYFKQLRLTETSHELPNLLRKAEQTSWTYREFVQEIVLFELKKREEKSIDKRMKWAKFPYVKTLKEFDLTEQTSLSQRQLSQLEELNWMEEQFNLILLGPPGSGKTHLSISLGIEAIQKGFQVMFVTMGELINLLKTREFTRKSQVLLNRIESSDLVIIDDLMYMAMDQREANLFFHLINRLYERSSIILTSNKSPNEWGELLGDEGITTAILDRLLHRVEIIHLNEDSYRMKHRKSMF
ncbi:ATP-binding protein [Ureibacillus massiliensis 4400831 = CIP 108448 = CCUG 49529]|uniref:ATP-binding protein n=1 Tax=Ureibacillus massiliensis 4400831 = CIP 108448 = CCUG 49529 TaxID=1211035 RepID=A0A0A3IHP4_9BACL|nr:IS21-like element helper ATPase IstB [Ureibacillus massiliensis]KGR84249.1 ATP-binding protein [Ureibacillus massiliensis 4400831 = CIP 108448 = CCUG 49529]